MSAIRIKRPIGRRIEEDIENAHVRRTTLRRLPRADQEKERGIGSEEQRLKFARLASDTDRRDQRPSRCQVEDDLSSLVLHRPFDFETVAVPRNGDAAFGSVARKIDRRAVGPTGRGTGQGQNYRNREELPEPRPSWLAPLSFKIPSRRALRSFRPRCRHSRSPAPYPERLFPALTSAFARRTMRAMKRASPSWACGQIWSVPPVAPSSSGSGNASS